MPMLRKVLHVILGTPIEPRQKQPIAKLSSYQSVQKERDIIRRESRIGSQLFGPIPAGHHREFFCLDNHTWVWFEEWMDPKTQVLQQMNVHYEIQNRGILKIVNGDPRGYVVGEELSSLVKAMEIYESRVSKEVYGFVPAHA